MRLDDYMGMKISSADRQVLARAAELRDLAPSTFARGVAIAAAEEILEAAGLDPAWIRLDSAKANGGSDA